MIITAAKIAMPGARVKASSANPPAVAAAVASHQSCRASNGPASLPGNSGGRPSPGDRVKAAKPAKPQNSPSRQSASPPRSVSPAAKQQREPDARQQIGGERVSRAFEPVLRLPFRRRGMVVCLARRHRRMFIGFGLQDQRHRAEQVRCRGQNPGKEPGTQRRQEQPAKAGHGLSDRERPSSAGYRAPRCARPGCGRTQPPRSRTGRAARPMLQRCEPPIALGVGPGLRLRADGVRLHQILPSRQYAVASVCIRAQSSRRGLRCLAVP